MDTRFAGVQTPPFSVFLHTTQPTLQWRPTRALYRSPSRARTHAPYSYAAPRSARAHDAHRTRPVHSELDPIAPQVLAHISPTQAQRTRACTDTPRAPRSRTHTPRSIPGSNQPRPARPAMQPDAPSTSRCAPDSPTRLARLTPWFYSNKL